MKRAALLILAALCLPQASGRVGVGVGVRDTRHVFASLTVKDHYMFKVEESVYSEQMRYQYFRLSAGYGLTLSDVSFSVMPFYGMTYGNTYRNFGVDVDVAWQPLKWIEIDASVMPFHDSGYGYTTAWMGRVLFNITPAVAITGAYTDKPEYRWTEKRLRLGVRFRSGPLRVMPEVSFSTEGRNSRTRMLISMAYTF